MPRLKEYMGIADRALGRGSAWLRPENSPYEAGRGGRARVCMVHRPREGFCPREKTSSKAGMWVCKDHTGFMVSHKLKRDRVRVGTREGASDMGRC